MDLYGHIIANEEVPSLDGATMPDVDPYTREEWATIACGGKADADRAIAAAREAFDSGPWPRMGYEKRQQLMHRLADLMEEHTDELAMADTLDMGKPITQARHDVARSILNVRFFADHARMSAAETLPMDTGHHAYTRWEPVGVLPACSTSCMATARIRRVRRSRRAPMSTASPSPGNRARARSSAASRPAISPR